VELDDARQVFLEECDEQLAQVEQVVLELSTGENDEAVNRCFRIFHSIKGGAGMTGFDQVAAYTHHVETVLDKLRSKQLQLSPELISVVLASKDHIEALFASANGSPPPSPETERALLDRLGRLAPLTQRREATVDSVGDKRLSIYLAQRAGEVVPPERLEAVLRDLRAKGSCTVSFEAGTTDGKRASTWSIELDTSESVSAVRTRLAELDTFVDVTIVQLSTEDGALRFVSDDGSIAELFRNGRSASAAEPAVATSSNVASGTAAAVVAKDGPEATKAGSTAKGVPADSMVRVSSSKLDHLVNLVSELVITQSRLVAVASRVGDAELAGPVEEVERLVGELREGVLGVRMMPIGSTFGRFKRLVHDLSGQLGKAVDLVTEGAETELDKSVLDQLVDPLLHLVRNSLDHGIEPTEARIAAGKPERGTVRLVAKHAGQRVVVTIQDDGKGLDAEAIRAKAIQRGLISADATLPQSELFKLIFLPGFSTAQALTSVSGRGVGMDVVKKQIEALRGSVRIQSERGVGTTMSLELPLTLAIIDGLLVEVGDDRYIMPLAAVTETVELPANDRSTRNGNRVVVVREDRVPYVSLRGVFDLPEEGISNEKVVILDAGEGRVGLVVDRVLGGHQTVIQSLGPLYEHNRAVSGATIMGDGRVALILDVAGIVQSSNTRDQASTPCTGRHTTASVVH
jgi:two-component system chemotaxis sensor kinase CheA